MYQRNEILLIKGLIKISRTGSFFDNDFWTAKFREYGFIKIKKNLLISNQFFLQFVQNLKFKKK